MTGVGFKHAAAALIGSWYLRLLSWSWRLDEQPVRLVAQRQRERTTGPGTIYAVWHSRILMSTATQGGHGAYILISQHGDGEYIAGAVKHLGFHTIRGSTTRGGLAALAESIRILRGGGDVALTPDGPRGPRMRAQVGCVLMAAKSGAAIVPVAFEAQRARRLRSWDRFIVPKFFTRVCARFGEPITVPRRATGDEIEKYRLLVEQRLTALTAAAAAEVGVAAELPDVDPLEASA